MARRFKDDVIEKHYWLNSHTSAYLLWGLYPEITGKNKKEKLNPELLGTFGYLPGANVSIHDVMSSYGSYDAILKSYVFSLATNIETFFKDFFELHIPDLESVLKKHKMKGNVFQRLKDVNKLLEVELDISIVLDELLYFMQVRHLFVHNDGLVDEKFIKNTGCTIPAGGNYILVTKELSEFQNAYRALLAALDKEICKS